MRSMMNDSFARNATTRARKGRKQQRAASNRVTQQASSSSSKSERRYLVQERNEEAARVLVVRQDAHGAVQVHPLGLARRNAQAKRVVR